MGVSCGVDLIWNLRSCLTWAGIQHTTSRSYEPALSALEQAGVQSSFLGAAALLSQASPSCRQSHVLAGEGASRTLPRSLTSRHAHNPVRQIWQLAPPKLEYRDFCCRWRPTCLVLWTRTLPNVWDVVRGYKPLRAETRPPASARTESVAHWPP